MKRETIYQRLRDIGCTVDTSDSMAEVLKHYRDYYIEAFIMWASGYTWDDICKYCNISTKTLNKMIKKIKKESVDTIKMSKSTKDE